MHKSARHLYRSLATAAFVAVSILASACSDEYSRSSPAVSGTPPSFTGNSATSAAPSTATGDLKSATVTRIVDGDTIEVLIDGQTYKVRYIGIDTPESVDPRRPLECLGKEAAERNHELVDGETVGLERDVSETDDFGRLLRYVWLGVEMVNATLVREGYAQAATYPPDIRYSDLFASLQSEARRTGRGLWGAACDSATPGPSASALPAGTCEYSLTTEPVIKGNISIRDDEKIYHVPGGEYYAATVVDLTAGERWFCTETEAVSAGWRRSLR